MGDVHGWWLRANGYIGWWPAGLAGWPLLAEPEVSQGSVAG